MCVTHKKDINIIRQLCQHFFAIFSHKFKIHKVTTEPAGETSSLRAQDLRSLNAILPKALEFN
ncbi:hypothetical protein DW944_11320 [Eubacterium ventriosum]|uniref:Uncharacterized protein n=1 Tax=Eubacterium ventriosum TaxID=39496 RepID=A0A413R4Z9_9FIRM|nr:hypothetical protein DW944_11320 [Eubacterium ventriosum]